MRKTFMFLIVTVVFGIFSSCSKSDDPVVPNPNVSFLATLSGANEVPANGSAFTGTATLTFNSTTKILTITVNHNVASATASHIHKAAAGVNGGVIFTFSSATSPINYTSIALDATQEADLMANMYYVNVHTAANPGGEIRGQLIKQ